jgi:hypothetical protein
MSYNFPGSLDAGSNLNNSRATGDTIPVTDHNDLASALIAVETKLGYSASTPATSGYVLTALGSGQSSWQAPTGGSGGDAFINVKNSPYNAVGNGSNDDTSAIQAAINAALATNQGTGTVYFPAGTYKITAALNCTSATGTSGGYGVILRGDGHRATRILKNSSFGPAVTYNGNGGPSGNNTQFGGLIDITIDGNASTGGLLQTNSAQQMFFRGCSFVGSNDWAWDLHTTQDSYFSQVTFNNCGSTTAPVIKIYGDANGTSNMLWFEQIRIETFLNGAIWITRGAGATGGGNNGFFFHQCKFENYPTVNGDFCVFDSYTQQLYMSQIFFSAGLFNSGYSTAFNAITFGSGGASPGFNQASFRDIFMNTGPTSGLGNSVININSGGNLSGTINIDNVFCDATLASGVVNVNNAAGADVVIGQLGGANTLVAGDGTAHRANAGTGTLSAGTVTISASRVLAGSRIILTPTSKSANSGILSVGTITGGTGFVVNSTNASDANTFNYEILN